MLKRALWQSMWPILEKIPRSVLKELYYFVLGWNFLKLSVRSIWVIPSLSSIIFLFSFCLGDLSTGESGVLESPTINVWGSIYLLSFNNESLTNMGAIDFGKWMLMIETLFSGFFPWWVGNVILLGALSISLRTPQG